MGSFADISGLVAKLPGMDEDAAAQSAARAVEIGLSGLFGDLAHWIAAWQGRHPAQVDHARICLFAGAHGVAPDETEPTGARLQKIIEGGAPVNQLVESVDADLKLFEMGLDQPTADFRNGPAMTEAQTLAAIAYGMTAVEPGVQLLVLGSIGADKIVAATLAHALLGGAPDDWVDNDADAQIVAAGSARWDPLDALARVGGQEIAAMLGALIAARAVQVPVLLDGTGACAAAATLGAIVKTAKDHTRIAYIGEDRGAARLAKMWDRAPILPPGLGVNPGEGAGALAIHILRGALACHIGMATE